MGVKGYFKVNTFQKCMKMYVILYGLCITLYRPIQSPYRVRTESVQHCTELYRVRTESIQSLYRVVQRVT